MIETETLEKPRFQVKVQPDAPHSNAVEAMHSTKYRLPGDLVNKATAELPDKQRSELRWLHSYGSNSNLSLEELAARVKKPNGGTYSRDSIYQALTGRRTDAGANLEPICTAIGKLRQIVEARASIKRAPFIETRLTKLIWKFCQGALNFQRIGFIVASSQIGKTTALEEYQRTHNHGETIYVRMPTGGGPNDFLKWLAKALRLPTGLKHFEIRERIIAAFDDRMLLIVDQCHECFGPYSRGKAISSLIFCMEIHDRAKCGLIMCGTKEFETGMKNALHHDAMVQLIKRGFPKPLRLPDKPDEKNLNEFASHYGLPPATGEALELQSETIRDLDLGVWLSFLQVASRIAARQNKVMTWAHVLQADATFNALGGETK